MSGSCLMLPIPMILLIILVRSLVSAFFLWLGMKITKEEGSFIGLLIASLAATFVRFIPILGLILSPIVLAWLVSHWTTAEFWPSAVLLVVVAWGLATLTQVGLMLLCV